MDPNIKQFYYDIQLNYSWVKCDKIFPVVFCIILQY